MIIHKQKDYFAPEFDVFDTNIEQGFGVSGGQLPEYEEDDDVIILG